ncbi:MAG: hypothetical protein AB1344_09340 [Pseudomonadota bacterium]
MKKTMLVLAAISALTALPATAHHFSPAEPDIGDMMDMHETMVDSLLESGTIQRPLDEAGDTATIDIDTGAGSQR